MLEFAGVSESWSSIMFIMLWFQVFQPHLSRAGKSPAINGGFFSWENHSNSMDYSPWSQIIPFLLMVTHLWYHSYTILIYIYTYIINDCCTIVIPLLYHGYTMVKPCWLPEGNVASPHVGPLFCVSPQWSCWPTPRLVGPPVASNPILSIQKNHQNCHKLR